MGCKNCGTMTPSFCNNCHTCKTADVALAAGSVTKRDETEADKKLGFWLSAALDDPYVCNELKEDIIDWMETFDYDKVIPVAEDSQ